MSVKDWDAPWRRTNQILDCSGAPNVLDRISAMKPLIVYGRLFPQERVADGLADLSLPRLDTGSIEPR